MPRQPKLLMLQGLIASGKSTYAKELVEKGWVRVNKDDLRAMLHNSHHGKGKENLVLWIRDEIVKHALSQGQNVVIDDTNFNKIHQSTLMGIGQFYNAEFEIKFIDTPLEECILRDSKREKPVGEMVIRGMYNQYLAKEKVVEKYVPNLSLPKAYIFDIDGTLAEMGPRSPYEWSKVGIDTVITPIADLLRRLEQTTEIIIVSGRDGVCRPETLQWLKDNNIPFSELFMRPAGDSRKDSIIKKEIFFRDIAPKYNALGVFDDRNQVVKMWREIGLTCFQCAEGDF